jgi:hypothetical protein
MGEFVSSEGGAPRNHHQSPMGMANAMPNRSCSAPAPGLGVAFAALTAARTLPTKPSRTRRTDTTVLARRPAGRDWPS